MGYSPHRRIDAIDVHYHHVSGRVTDVCYKASIQQNGEGNMSGVFAARRDLTECKPAEVKQRADGGPA